MASIHIYEISGTTKEKYPILADPVNEELNEYRQIVK